MNIHITCLYCGYNWSEQAFSATAITKKCLACGDKNLKVKSEEESKIDYYQGSPPFPKKEEEVKERDWEWF